MRATGTILQPRVDVADGQVLGYIAKRRDADSARLGPAITDLELGFGSGLLDLREGWEPDANTTADAQTEWKYPGSVSPSARETVLLADSTWWTTALADARSFNQTLARVSSNDRAAWGWAANRVAGVLAIWSWRTEPLGGRLQSPRTKSVSRHLRPEATRARPFFDRPRPIWNGRRSFWLSYAVRFAIRPSNLIWSAN
ncbi:hypothetical protein [Nocardia sp. SC052]|uniref:hypothetical protein n=1 Tax=Nocardia sichangensis TaxID=3385975 RepID=UPI00399F9C2D